MPVPEYSVEEKPNKLLSSLIPTLYFLALIWLLHVIQWTIDTRWITLGIYPREIFGLKGILFAPLIHGDFSHLGNNSVPFLVLGTMILFFYRKVAFRSFTLIYILTGIAVWLLARDHRYHIGLSGVVFGLLAFVLGSGFFRRNIKAIVLALIVLFFYSGMLVGLFPTKEGISWESHLSGFLVGIFAAFYYKEEIEIDEIEQPPSWELEDNDPNRPYYFRRDVFEKTKAERIQEAEARRRAAEERRNNPPDWTSTPS